LSCNLNLPECTNGSTNLYNFICLFIFVEEVHIKTDNLLNLFEDHKFSQHPCLANGHLQTIAGRYLPDKTVLARTRSIEVDLDDGDRLLCLENHPGSKSPLRKLILLAHGLGGEAESTYMRRIAGIFHSRGWITVRMNHRGCGTGAGLARNMYHSGRSEDVSAVLQKLQVRYSGIPAVAVGFSLSGNVLLKLLGEQRFIVPDNLHGAVAVTPPVLLSECADALVRRSNRIYDRRFVRMLVDEMAVRNRKFSTLPGLSFPKRLTVRQFDEICTAPLNGFRSADDYYQRCSARQFLKDIRVPTFILAADNDPFIPVTAFGRMPDNNRLRLHITRGGGHMGFISKSKTPLENHRWMDYVILKTAESFIKTAAG
jgi:predicted alpha/beta-fold hydrolase